MPNPSNTDTLQISGRAAAPRHQYVTSQEFLQVGSFKILTFSGFSISMYNIIHSNRVCTTSNTKYGVKSNSVNPGTQTSRENSKAFPSSSYYTLWN